MQVDAGHWPDIGFAPPHYPMEVGSWASHATYIFTCVTINPWEIQNHDPRVPWMVHCHAWAVAINAPPDIPPLNPGCIIYTCVRLAVNVSHFTLLYVRCGDSTLNAHMHVHVSRSVIAGMMWFKYDKELNVRHTCEHGDKLQKFGWIRHDGISFGQQEILDSGKSVLHVYLLMLVLWIVVQKRPLIN